MSERQGRASPATPRDGCAWVTGASSGLGREIALELARRGWTVAASARRADALEALAAQARDLPGRIAAHPADVSDSDGVARAAAQIRAQHGPVALLVANAGIYLPMDARRPDPDVFARTFAVNVQGTVHCLAATVPDMVARGRGQLALVASVTGYGGLPTAAAYGASKAALINLAETLRIELDPAGIHVQVINPGFIDTPATKGNAFPMPALMRADEAARRVAAGLARGAFEIAFPRRFVWPLKLLMLLPARLRLGLVRWATGWSRRTGAASQDG